jgi:hypothetical protein
MREYNKPGSNGARTRMSGEGRANRAASSHQNQCTAKNLAADFGRSKSLIMRRKQANKGNSFWVAKGPSPRLMFGKCPSSNVSCSFHSLQTLSVLKHIRN